MVTQNSENIILLLKFSYKITIIIILLYYKKFNYEGQ